jgi:hypothetical protein
VITYPLLPWLYSAEICEHIFGLCRQIQQDFTFLDFLYMVPKLSIRLREHALLGHFSDGKERAHGYNHTYNDFRGVNLVNLSTYPTDLDIKDALQEGHHQAEHLWSILGVVPPFGGEPQLPSIHSWFTEDDPSSDTSGDPKYESAVEDANIDEGSVALEIEHALRQLEEASNLTSKEEDLLSQLAYATAALTVDDSLLM